MKTVFISAIAALSLAACATGPTAYGPAQSQSALGFTNQQIENDRFLVSFTGRNADEARNLALLRAAEITLAQNYQNFRVVGSETRGNDHRSPVSSSIGIGVGSGGGYHRRRGTRTNVGVGIGINDLGQMLNGNKVTASMEILLGNGAKQGMDNVYAARSIVESIRPHTFTN